MYEVVGVRFRSETDVTALRSERLVPARSGHMVAQLVLRFFVCMIDGS